MLKRIDGREEAAPRRGSEDVDGIRRNPDDELLEAGLESFLQAPEELDALRRVRNVHEHPRQVVAVGLPLLLPEPVDRLGLGRHGTEPLLEFEQRVGDQVRRHRLAVIEP